MWLGWCSVSMPFKQDVLALVDQVEKSARTINAVNTIVNDTSFNGVNLLDGTLAGGASSLAVQSPPSCHATRNPSRMCPIRPMPEGLTSKPYACARWRRRC